MGNGEMWALFDRYMDKTTGMEGTRLKVSEKWNIVVCFLTCSTLDGITHHTQKDEVDFSYYSRQTDDMQRTHPGLKSHFAVVAKVPCLAIKYPVDHGLSVSEECT